MAVFSSFLNIFYEGFLGENLLIFCYFCCRSDLEAVERECSKFEAEVRRVCGEFVTVAGIIREAKEQECRVQQLVCTWLRLETVHLS